MGRYMLAGVADLLSTPTRTPLGRSALRSRAMVARFVVFAESDGTRGKSLGG
jgi:hypothetical protein